MRVLLRVFECFNSILVQLEAYLLSSAILCMILFQFHIGAIRSEVLTAAKVNKRLFQFHIGAIRSVDFVSTYAINK